MTEENSKAAFRGAGLVPLDPEHVVSKLDVQLRTPTPVEEETGPSTPRASKTPKTVLEVGSQSEYLAKRIRRHHSSSPESVLEALKSLSKGTKAVMHEVSSAAINSSSSNSKTKYSNIIGELDQVQFKYLKLSN
jgi:hypothetical protein